MSVVFDFLFAFLVIGGAFLVGYQLVVRARNQNRKFGAYDENDEFVPIALCETRTGIKTHYHKLHNFGALNYTGYPIKGHPTLCGAEVGWDMKNQDAEATCETCRESLAKMAGKP